MIILSVFKVHDFVVYIKLINLLITIADLLLLTKIKNKIQHQVFCRIENGIVLQNKIYHLYRLKF